MKGRGPGLATIWMRIPSVQRGRTLLAALALFPVAVWGCGDASPESALEAGRARPTAAPARPAAPAPEPVRPAHRNLLLITLDTTRADALVPYGQTLPSSPTLDRVAREGVLFEQAASTSPSTLPSHATIFTGHYPLSHGVRSNSGYRLPEAHTTLAELLRTRGFRTGAEIASTVLDASKGLAQGFDHYRDLRSRDVERIRARSSAPGEPEVELDERPASDVTRFGKRFLDAREGEPFFLWLHYFDPHRFYFRRPEVARMLPGDDGYLAEVRYTDASIGELLAHLEARGLRERTLVVVVADHGEGRGEHDESTHAYFVYESTIRVPLLLWGPSELPAGLRIAAPVRTADVMPTALDWLGVDVPQGLDGRSLLPLLSGEPAGEAPSAYGESIEFARVFAGSPLRYLRRGDWKYIHQVEPELYHLGRDPGELENLAAQHPERVAALREELEALVRAAAPAHDAAAEVSAAERERLAALGYVAGEETGASAEALASLELGGPSPSQQIADVERAVEAVGQLRLGQPSEAEPLLAELVARYPRSATLHRDHAEALLALGRRNEARTALERAVALSGCAASARVQLAELLRAEGDRAGQHAVLRDGAAQCGESSPEVLNNYAWVLATSPVDALRDGAEAERVARRALALFGGEAPEILDTVAAAQAEQGVFDAAEATLRRAIAQARAQQRPPALTAMLQQSLARVQARQPIRDE